MRHTATQLKPNKIYLIACLLIAPCMLAAQQVRHIVIDVASQVPGAAARFDVERGDNIQVEFANLVPARLADYRLTVTREVVALSAPLATQAPVVSAGSAHINSLGAVCPQLMAALQAVHAVSLVEGNVPAVLALLDVAANTQPIDGTCSAGQLAELRGYATAVKNSTSATQVLGTMAAGERLTVTLSRPTITPGTPSGSIAWTVITQTSAASGWVTTGGVAVIPQVFMKRQEAFLKTADGKTTVESTATTAEIDRPLSITFAYIDREHRGYGITFSPFTVTIALSTSDPAIGLGTGITFWDNLVVAVGMAVHSQTAPRPEYVGSGIAAPAQVSADQLNRKRGAVNPFLAIGLRLDRDLFNVFGGQTGQK